MVVQQLVNGVLLGGVYSIIGVGFSLVYGVMGIINLAHGSLLMFGSYITFQIFSWLGLDPFAGLVIAAILMFALGYLQQRYIINRVISHGVQMSIVLTFGLDLVLINIALLIWSSDYRSVSPRYVSDSFMLGDVVIPYVRLAIFVAALVITLVLYLFLYRTRTGQAIRATALHNEAAQLVGVNVEKIYSLTFGLGAAIAAAAGGLLSMVLTVTPFMGAPLLSNAFAVAVLGGLGNVKGAVFAGVILGIAEALGITILGASYQAMMGYLILILVLMVRPQGLFGRKV